MKKLTLPLFAFAMVLLVGCQSDAEIGTSPSTSAAPVDPAVAADATIPEGQKKQASEMMNKVPQEFRDKMPQGTTANPNSGK
ncbi:MAG: hypothetical protein MUC92_13440 [Fimbriimonadaceae bacterium]|jgi:hypothetical protein|nr:hypothetical protein [Fimbriimonadaceae bacterium]